MEGLDMSAFFVTESTTGATQTRTPYLVGETPSLENPVKVQVQAAIVSWGLEWLSILVLVLLMAVALYCCARKRRSYPLALPNPESVPMEQVPEMQVRAEQADAIPEVVSAPQDVVRPPLATTSVKDFVLVVDAD